MKKNFSLFLILLTSCAFGKKKQDLNRIEFRNVADISLKLGYPIEKMCDSVIPIPLEINDQCLIREITDIQESKNFLWIISDGRLYQFASNGKLIRMIGSVGQGPKEYISAWSMQINNQEELVYVLDYFGRKLMTYKFDGQLLNTQSLPDGYAYNTIYNLGSDIYLYSIFNSLFPDLLLYKGPNHSGPISISERNMGMEGFLGNTFMYSVNDEIGLYHYFNDTIYRLQNQRLVPKYILDLGELKYSFQETELGKDYSHKHKIFGCRLQVTDCFETSKYLFLSYMLNGYKDEKSVSLLFMYDKINGVKYEHVNFIYTKIPELSIKKGKKIKYSNYSNSLIASFQIEEIEHVSLSLKLGLSDNPIIVKYYLK